MFGKGFSNGFKTDERKRLFKFSFNPSDREKKEWIKNGFPKLSHLLTALKIIYIKSNNFELIFFRTNSEESFYFQSNAKTTNVYVNIDKYLEHGRAINEIMYQLKIVKYSNRIQKEYSEKIPPAFFNKRLPSELPNLLKTSYYAIIEKIINDIERMPDGEEKTKLSAVLIQSKLAIKSFEKFKKLPSKSPAKKLQEFTPVLGKLTSKEAEILLMKIMNSAISVEFINNIAKLPKEYLDKIVKKLPEMTIMYGRYEKLKDSLKKFRVLINKHKNSSTKNEAEIHKFLTKHYWLLGIEYFDKEMLSDFTHDGSRINATKIEGSRKHPDFIIKRIDGFDKCVVIELEESNDSYFQQKWRVFKKSI